MHSKTKHREVVSVSLYARQSFSVNIILVPVSSIGCIVGIAGLGAVAVMVQVRSQVEAISF
jgi:hypothetical protein